MVDGTSVNSDDTTAGAGSGLLGEDGILGDGGPDADDIERQRLANDAQQRGGGNEGAGAWPTTRRRTAYPAGAIRCR